VVSESLVTWATSVPILVFLGLSHLLGWGHNKETFFKLWEIQWLPWPTYKASLVLL